jgi:iron complex transport system ATP-binding protein
MGLEQGIDLRAVDAWLGPSLLFQEFDPTLKTGEHTVMLGPNGAGKSALIQLLSREI